MLTTSSLPSAPLSEPQKQALHWLSRLRDAECSEQDSLAFQDWLLQSTENAQAFEQAQLFWDQLGGLPDMAGKRLQAARRYAGDLQSSRRKRNITLIIAAIAVGLIAYDTDPFLKLTADQYQTAKGQHIEIDLADGSRIELNTDSQLRVASLLYSRKVWLEHGEAWFNIKHDSNQPFEVLVGEVRIRDIGTQFNVTHDRDNTLVAVAEGEVALSMAGSHEVSITAGQQGEVNAAGQLQPVAVSDLKAIGGWRDGMLIFKQQKLPELLHQLARYHQVEFELPDANLQSLTVSGHFSTTDLDENLNTLSNALGVKIIRLTTERILIRTGG